MVSYSLNKPAPKSTIRKILGKSIIFVVGLLIFFAALEFLTRHYCPSHLSAFFAAYDLKPGLPYLSFGNEEQQVDFAQKAKTINELGFQSAKEIPIEKGENTYRIFFLGGSVAKSGGYDIPPERRYYALLEQKLNAAFPSMKFECISAGVESYVSNQELVWFIFSRIAEMSPDIIIMFDGYNDIAFPINFWSQVGYPYNYNHKNKLFSSPWYYFIGKSANHSVLLNYYYNYLIKKEIDRGRQKFLNDSEATNNLALNYTANMEKIASLLCAYQPQAKMFVTLQPIISHKQKLTNREQEVLYKDFVVADYVKKAYPVFIQHLNKSAILKEKDVTIADITDTFADYADDVYRDTSHLSQDGHGSRILAERFYEILRPVIYTQLNPDLFKAQEPQVKEVTPGKIKKESSLSPVDVKTRE
ncbi:MAG: SGNH/GDSL hydrolase family protein [Candidatus Schekmanbacteria bacterium]|nr:SGNH/GDSL hydrolase family protein [Candidatus Schekmanbacteria bacterium]